MSKSKLKIGDKVKVRPGISAGYTYGGVPFVKEMETYRRCQVEIKDIIGVDEYRIDLDDGCWTWSLDMFTKDSVEEAIKNREKKFKNGDVVIVVSKEEYDGDADLKDAMFGKKGVYYESSTSTDSGWIQFYENVGGHDGNGQVPNGKDGYCWSIKNRYLKPATNEYQQIDYKEQLDTLIASVNKLTESNKNSRLEEAMIEGIISKGKDLATEDLKKELKEELDEFIRTTYGAIPRKILIENNYKKKELKGIFHKEFDNICKMVASNIPLMLVGGAGAGKNHTLEQVAEALDMKFYTTNAVNQDFKLTGFIDANGKYHETEFYKAFKDGGMFFLDEIDASCPEALIILNGAIANRYFDFPNGRIKANENFRVVCAGNTYGTGADMVYVGRNVLDGATLDRFVVLQFDYDEEVEKQLAYDLDLYNFIRDLRKAVNSAGLRYIVSMRALINSTKMLEIGMDKRTILETTIIKNMQKDDLNLIIQKLDKSNSWYDEIKRMCD